MRVTRKSTDRLAEGSDPRPGTGRTRRGLRKGDQREAAIIETARRLLATQSPGSITIEQLAAGAGISRSAFYFYFDSRDAVMRAVVDDLAVTLEPIVTAFLESDGTIADRVRAVVAAYLRRWREQGHVLRAMYELAESDPEFARSWDTTANRSVALVASVIEAEQRVGRALPPPPSADDVAAAVVAMLWRTGHQLSAGEPWTDNGERLVDTMTALSLRLVYGTSDVPD